jgi:hypothetical protein
MISPIRGGSSQNHWGRGLMPQCLNCPKITGGWHLGPSCGGGATVCHSSGVNPSQTLGAGSFTILSFPPFLSLSAFHLHLPFLPIPPFQYFHPSFKFNSLFPLSSLEWDQGYNPGKFFILTDVRRWILMLFRHKIKDELNCGKIIVTHNGGPLFAV